MPNSDADDLEDFSDTAQELKQDGTSAPEPTTDVDDPESGSAPSLSLSKTHVGIALVVLVVVAMLVQRRRSTATATASDETAPASTDSTAPSGRAQEEFDKVQDMTAEVAVEPTNQTPAETIPQGSPQEQDEAVARILEGEGAIKGARE
ncbi:hypothetical protein [Haladaptatus cibarius]|uniref:hypothetical protein n=1 Tax=Haladaptatus cibarius TaxID=453847 RepID=UPI000678DAD3|nr:hypothetical protein [Haladaptatus cibarius]